MLIIALVTAHVTYCFNRRVWAASTTLLAITDSREIGIKRKGGACKCMRRSCGLQDFTGCTSHICTCP